MWYELIKVFGLILTPVALVAALVWFFTSRSEPDLAYEQAMFDCEAYGGVYERHWGKGREEPSHGHRACMIGSRHLWTDSRSGRLYAKGVAIPPIL